MPLISNPSHLGYVCVAYVDGVFYYAPGIIVKIASKFYSLR